MSSHVRKLGGGVLPLTGTPITNDYTDIHRIFCIMAPGVFGNKTAFEAKYCPENVYKKKIFGGMFQGKPRWMVAKEYAAAKKAEALLVCDPDIVSYTSYVGQGAPRFWLGLNPVLPNANFAQIVIVTKNLEARDRVKARLEKALADGVLVTNRLLHDTFLKAIAKTHLL